jgi:hypothetical protein
MPSRFSATYVYVGFIPTSAQVATYADRQETMQSKGGLAPCRGSRNRFEGVTEDQLAFQIVPSTGISHHAGL